MAGRRLAQVVFLDVVPRQGIVANRPGQIVVSVDEGSLAQHAPRTSEVWVRGLSAQGLERERGEKQERRQSHEWLRHGVTRKKRNRRWPQMAARLRDSWTTPMRDEVLKKYLMAKPRT